MKPNQTSERNWQIIRMRIDGYKFKEIAEKFGISNTRVKQIWRSYEEAKIRERLSRILTNDEKLLCSLLNLRYINTMLKIILEPNHAAR